MAEHKSCQGSSSSGEVPVKFELEVTGGSSSSGREFDGGEAVAGDGALSNGGGNSAGTADNGRNVPRINTSPVEILSADVSVPPSSQVKLEISKTEKRRINNILAEEAAQIFDDKIPVQQKDYGHRVRVATHSNFKDFVLTAGLEFYPLGGDPKILAGFIYLDNMFSRHTHVAEALKVPLAMDAN